MTISTTKARRPRTSRSPTERSARVAELADRLKRFADSTSPAQQAAYEARFDHYSPRNAMLIVMQMPDATVVRGFHAWKDEGRRVRKGEHGIQILAPAGAYADRDASKTDDAGGEHDPEKVHRFFRVAFVFDISQTEKIEEGADE
jgi:antirestriction protein ArdC